MRALPIAVLLFTIAPPLRAEAPPRFQFGSVFQQDISTAVLHPQSQSMIDTVMGICSGDASGCGFGFGRMQIDRSIHILHADSMTPTLTLADHASYGYYDDGSCEAIGTAVPMPVGGAIEGAVDYNCNNDAEDCHLLVARGNELFELYSARQNGATVEALCLATWHLDAVYPEALRGDHCTSADAAGFPIAPLLFNADEVFAALSKPPADRHLGHAIRFILPNDRMASNPDGPDEGSARDPLYVRPATHAGGPDGPIGAIPYGSRLRLKADFDMTGYSEAARVILRTMQRFGIVLSDGGRIALTSESDMFTTHTWAELGIEQNEFYGTAGAMPVNLNHFEIIDTGPRIPETYDCVRTTVASSLFLNGFE